MYNPEKYHNSLGPDDSLMWEGWDLDKTLAEQVWPEPGIGKPIKQSVDYLKQRAELGYKPIIFTSRASSEYKDISQWLDDHEIPFKWIITGKPLMNRYYDDKNFFLPWVNKEENSTNLTTDE